MLVLLICDNEGLYSVITKCHLEARVLVYTFLDGCNEVGQHEYGLLFSIRVVIVYCKLWQNRTLFSSIRSYSAWQKSFIQSVGAV